MSYGWPPSCSLVLPGVPPAILPGIDPSQLIFETWAGDEVSSRSAMQYVKLASGGATFNVTFPEPDSGDTVTRGICEMEIIASPVAPVGGLRRQEQAIVGIDGFGSDPKTFFAHRFRMQSLEPDGANYEINAGGIARYISTTTNSYAEGVFMFYDRTIGVQSWVVRCVRAGVPVDIKLNIPWDNAFHTVGFLHDGVNVLAFADAVEGDSYGGAEIQPATGTGPVAAHIVAAMSGTDNGKIQSDWVAWGPSA